MKILLINPPFQRLKGLQAIYFPLGLGYIASSLEKAGFECSIYNAELPREKLYPQENIHSYLLSHHDDYISSLNNPNHFVWTEVKNILNEFKPDLVGISVMSAKYGSALKLSYLVKEYNPDCLVVWGGQHPTIETERVLGEQNVDFVLRGEVEESFPEFAQKILNQRTSEIFQIKGISYKENNKIVHNPEKPIIKELDNLPFPGRELSLDFKLYPSSLIGDLITTRGCSFQCGFCSTQSIAGRRVRTRKPENVVKEIEELIEKYKTTEIHFVDDTFTANRKYVFELCQEIIKNKLFITWTCTTRVDVIDEEVIKIMAQSGCTYLDIGIETGSPKMLEAINKGMNLEQVNRAVKIMRKYGIGWGVFFMIGFPEETEQDLKKTIELMKKMDSSPISLSIFTPYPGTKLYESAKRLNLIPEVIDWSEYSHQSIKNTFTKYIDYETFFQYASFLSEWVDKHNLKVRSNLSNFKRRLKLLLNPKVLVWKISTKLRRKLKYKF